MARLGRGIPTAWFADQRSLGTPTCEKNSASRLVKVTRPSPVLDPPPRERWWGSVKAHGFLATQP